MTSFSDYYSPLSAPGQTAWVNLLQGGPLVIMLDHVALGKVEEARQTIDAVPERHPFALRYHEVECVDWESCARVLDDDTRRRTLARGWGDRTNEQAANHQPPEPRRLIP